MKRERGTGGLIKIAGCRFWYAQYYDRNGRQLRVSTKTEVKQEAQSVLRNKMSELDRGIAPTSSKMRYADLRKALLDDYARAGNKSLQTLADGSETVWGLKALDDFFEYDDNRGWPVTRITVDAVRDFVRKRQRDKVGNATINRSLACLRRMFQIAQDDGKLHVAPKIKMLKEPPARKGFTTRGQFAKLIGALPERLRPLITFLYYCGCRLGEALQITWSQVDLPAGLIRLEPEQTKTDEARIVPLPDVLIAMLAPMEPKEGAVFTGENLRKSWCRACAAVGLGTLDTKTWRYSGLIIHDLRRSAIKNLMTTGTPEKVCMSISGHKTRTVFDRYHIVDSGDVLRAMRRVELAANQIPQVGENIVKSAPLRRAINKLTA